MNALDVLIGQTYCKICDFEAYASSIMGNPTQRSEHIKDATDFFTAVASGTLPAVSFVKPDGLIDGSSATSKLDLCDRVHASALVLALAVVVQRPEQGPVDVGAVPRGLQIGAQSRRGLRIGVLVISAQKVTLSKSLI
jgi:hypothetical protein